MSQPTAHSEVALHERQARVQADVATIRAGLQSIILNGARSLGWSEADAQLIVYNATLEYFQAISRHMPPTEALRWAAEESDRKHIVQYVTLTAKEGKVSLRHALVDVLAKRIDTADVKGQAALQAALHQFDAAILQAHSVDTAVSAARDAALAILSSDIAPLTDVVGELLDNAQKHTA